MTSRMAHTCNYRKEQEQKEKQKNTADPTALPKYFSGSAGGGGSARELKVISQDSPAGQLQQQGNTSRGARRRSNGMGRNRA